MSYGIVWEPEVHRVFRGLDPAFVAAVLDGGNLLATAPTRLSRPNGHPHYGTDQRYGFAVEGRSVTLFFRYGQDEQTLYIRDVSILPPFTP